MEEICCMMVFTKRNKSSEYRTRKEILQGKKESWESRPAVAHAAGIVLRRIAPRPPVASTTRKVSSWGVLPARFIHLRYSSRRVLRWVAPSLPLFRLHWAVKPI